MIVQSRSRGYLPHWEKSGSTYFVTFRLADSLPGFILRRWAFERKDIEARARAQNRELTKYECERLAALFSERVDKYLDLGAGRRWLVMPDIAALVVSALKFMDGQRYALHAWCVMPNHVHVVVTPVRKFENAKGQLGSILHSWKSYTAKEANRILRRTGEFWCREYYDHLIRDGEEHSFYIGYTLNNPVKAGFCKAWDEWPWSGCSTAVRPTLRDKP